MEKKFLSMSPEAEMNEIADIGVVVTPGEEEYTGHRVICGRVIGVQSIEEYRSCVLCNSKVETTSTDTGWCSRCQASWRLAECGKEVAARLVVRGDDGQIYKVTDFKN